MKKNEADPLKILQSLLERVQARRESELDPAAQEGQDTAAAAGAELVPDYKGRNVYISFDGDNIGNAVARAESRDDEEELASISNKINAGQRLFVDFLINHQGRPIEAGGDEGLGICNSKCLADIESFREDYFNLVGATVTVGVGEKISQATKARMLGKLRGKDQVCHYGESTEKEIEMRTEQGGHEAEKLGQAGLLEPQAESQEQAPVPKFGIDPSSSGAEWQQEYEAPEEENEIDESQSEDSFDQPEEEGQDDESSEEPIEGPEEEYYDYTDLPFELNTENSHRKLSKQIAKEHGADPRFLFLAAKNLFRN